MRLALSDHLEGNQVLALCAGAASLATTKFNWGFNVNHITQCPAPPRPYARAVVATSNARKSWVTTQDFSEIQLALAEKCSAEAIPHSWWHGTVDKPNDAIKDFENCNHLVPCNDLAFSSRTQKPMEDKHIQCVSVYHASAWQGVYSRKAKYSVYQSFLSARCKNRHIVKEKLPGHS